MMKCLESKELIKIKFSDKGYMFSSKEILEEKLDCHMVAHIHDEMQLHTQEDITEYVGKSAVKSIQSTKEFFNFRCELDGEYKIGRTWADTH